jgi:uncharacterized membrane protein
LLGVMSFALVAVGTLALVLPGLYVAVCAMYAPFLVVDRELSPWHALMTSRDAVHESFVAHVGLAVVLVLVNLGGLACLGLGLLVTIPLTFVVLGVAYGRFLGYGTGVDRLTA